MDKNAQPPIPTYWLKLEVAALERTLQKHTVVRTEFNPNKPGTYLFYNAENGMLIAKVELLDKSKYPHLKTDIVYFERINVAKGNYAKKIFTPDVEYLGYLPNGDWGPLEVKDITDDLKFEDHRIALFQKELEINLEPNKHAPPQP